MLIIREEDLRRVDQNQGKDQKNSQLGKRGILIQDRSQIQRGKLNIEAPGLQREENLDPVQNQQLRQEHQDLSQDHH